MFTDPTTGGILDDLIVCSTSENKLFVVSNAGRRQHDQKLMLQAVDRLRAAGKDVQIRFLEPDEQSLLALQGPGAAQALAPLLEGVDIAKLYFMRTTTAKVMLTDETNCSGGGTRTPILSIWIYRRGPHGY